jgi:4-diphosphocytidyl-2-C-methyl-D-erythritol kinase
VTVGQGGGPGPESAGPRPRGGALRTEAPGKVNLCLFVGPARDDGLHELVSLVQPLDLADGLTMEPAEHDEVVCPGVDGENLAARALAAYREASGWDESQRLTIQKRVPVAAGMGGGSSDAAATLRLAAHAAGRPGDPRIHELAPRLGSDVPALLHSRATLVTGAGEEVTAIPGPALDLPGAATGPPAGEARPAAQPAPVHFVVMPSPARLAAAEVYAEADRLGLVRLPDDLDARRAEVEAALKSGGLPLGLVRNDLQDAARSLCAAIDGALDAAAQAGADTALVSGSGPTVVALFAQAEPAQRLAAGWPGAVVARPAPPALAEIRTA